MAEHTKSISKVRIVSDKTWVIRTIHKDEVLTVLSGRRGEDSAQHLDMPANFLRMEGHDANRGLSRSNLSEASRYRSQKG